MGNKICSKCKKEKLATLKYFYPKKHSKDKLRYDCKECFKEGRRNFYGKNRKTIIGCLQYCYMRINQRCNYVKRQHYKYYGGRGIKLRFTISEFINYVKNTLHIDPRGLQIHRINNNGHYEKGNIEFLTPKEHSLRHKVGD